VACKFVTDGFSYFWQQSGVQLAITLKKTALNRTPFCRWIAWR
jgi:hypothetical protein